jgi:hypothetical protein
MSEFYYQENKNNKYFQGCREKGTLTAGGNVDCSPAIMEISVEVPQKKKK